MHHADVAHLWQSLVADIATSHLPVLLTLTSSSCHPLPQSALLVAVELRLSSLLPLDDDCCIVDNKKDVQTSPQQVICGVANCC
jgi:hypothetical protein